MNSRPGLSRPDIEALFRAVASEAVIRNVEVSLFLVGGAAMAIAYNTERATTDLDGIFEPKALVYEIARKVAADLPQYGLTDDWINDAVKGLLPGDDPEATVKFSEPGLSVRVASPRYLFKMKAVAGRDSDLDDLRVLYPLAAYSSATEALDDVMSTYPPGHLKPSVQYLIESIAAEHDAKSDHTPKQSFVEKLKSKLFR
jgi:hypothetical protein